jgi:hypothetical protein
VKPILGIEREISYNDQWHRDGFYQNEVSNHENAEQDISQIPLPFLRSGLFQRRRPDKDKQQPYTIGLLWNYLYGQKTEKKEEKVEEASNASFQTVFKGRTRRPTKYKVKGNCKNPPKKHPRDSDRGSGSDSDRD